MVVRRQLLFWASSFKYASKLISFSCNSSKEIGFSEACIVEARSLNLSPIPFRILVVKSLLSTGAFIMGSLSIQLLIFCMYSIIVWLPLVCYSLICIILPHDGLVDVYYQMLDCEV